MSHQKNVSPFLDSPNKREQPPLPTRTRSDEAAQMRDTAQRQFEYALKLHERKVQLLHQLDAVTKMLCDEISIIEEKYQGACKISREIDEKLNHIHIYGTTREQIPAHQVLVYDFSPDK